MRLRAGSSAGSVSRTAHAGFVLDALEQALHDRKPVSGGGLVHHSDRGVQYVSIRYSARLSEAGIEPSVGSVGDSYDNALAETVNGCTAPGAGNSFSISGAKPIMDLFIFFHICIEEIFCTNTGEHKN